MLKKHLKTLVVMVAAISVVAAGSAMAATVRVTPGGAVTGMANLTPRFTFNTARKTLTCTSAEYTATYAGGSGVTLPFNVSTNFQPLFGAGTGFGSCTVTGGAGITITCAAANFAVTSFTASNTTDISLQLNCQVAIIGATCSVNINGRVPGDYENAGHTVSILVALRQSLAATGSSSGIGRTCASLPNDTSVSFSSSAGSDLDYIGSLPSQSIVVS
jgi:hypothetical protein